MTQPLYYKDLFAGKTSYTEKELGRKGLSLAHLVAHNIPVPPFFILQPDLFRSIVVDIFKDKSVTSLAEFRKKISQDPLSTSALSQIEIEYTRLSGFGKAWVAVRSSIVAPEHPNTSFSGLLSSKLNVRGVPDIEGGIKEIFMSLFSDRAYDYFKRNNISYGDVSTAIVVQKMIQAEVSGIMYTYDPITTNNDHVSIEAVFGLGDVLTDGNVNPDIYTVSKSSLDIVEKKIVPQEWMKVRRMGDTESLEHLQKITISKMWQYSQKLDDALIRELTKLADTIEKALGGPQVIEWAMERGVLYVLQAKPIAAAVNTELKDLHATTRKISSVEDLDTFSKLANHTKVKVEIKSEEKPVIALPQETLLFTGTPASPGVAYGEALLIPKAEALSEEMIESFKKTVTKKHIIVTDEFTSSLEQLFFLAGGVVTSFGGANSDVAIIAREALIPAIVGTRIATTYLQSGTLLKLDGASGAIYRVEFIPEELPPASSPSQDSEKPKKKKKLKKKKKIAQESVIVEAVPVEVAAPRKKLEAHDSPIKMFLSEKSNPALLYCEELATVPHDLAASALMVPVGTADKKTISTIKKLRKDASTEFYLLLSDIPSFDSLLQLKRDLAAQGIRRSKRVKFIALVGSVYGVMNTKALSDLGLDGLLFDTLSLSHAYKPGSKSVDPEVFTFIAQALDVAKDQKYSYLGLLLANEYLTIPLRKELHICTKKGILSFVFPESTASVSQEDITQFSASVISVQLG